MAKWLMADGKTGAFQPSAIIHLPCQMRFQHPAGHRLTVIIAEFRCRLEPAC
jgi:hypothetical protein